ncbi:MAG: hypothetical protein NTW86_19660 [Candidatus Sumerlaeota bacterium]|nr:hypothetical protein [Candidatus Sumerlaeota bacterium]
MDFRERIGDYLEGAMSDEERETFELRMAADEELRRAVWAERRLIDLLAAAERPAAPEGFRGKVLERARSGEVVEAASPKEPEIEPSALGRPFGRFGEVAAPKRVRFTMASLYRWGSLAAAALVMIVAIHAYRVFRWPTESPSSNEAASPSPSETLPASPGASGPAAEILATESKNTGEAPEAAPSLDALKKEIQNAKPTVAAKSAAKGKETAKPKSTKAGSEKDKAELARGKAGAGEKKQATRDLKAAKGKSSKPEEKRLELAEAAAPTAGEAESRAKAGQPGAEAPVAAPTPASGMAVAAGAIASPKSSPVKSLNPRDASLFAAKATATPEEAHEAYRVKEAATTPPGLARGAVSEAKPAMLASPAPAKTPLGELKNSFTVLPQSAQREALATPTPAAAPEPRQLAMVSPVHPLNVEETPIAPSGSVLGVETLANAPSYPIRPLRGAPGAGITAPEAAQPSFATPPERERMTGQSQMPGTAALSGGQAMSLRESPGGTPSARRMDRSQSVYPGPQGREFRGGLAAPTERAASPELQKAGPAASALGFADRSGAPFKGFAPGNEPKALRSLTRQFNEPQSEFPPASPAPPAGTSSAPPASTLRYGPSQLAAAPTATGQVAKSTRRAGAGPSKTLTVNRRAGESESDALQRGKDDVAKALAKVGGRMTATETTRASDGRTVKEIHAMVSAGSVDQFFSSLSDRGYEGGASGAGKAAGRGGSEVEVVIRVVASKE